MLNDLTARELLDWQRWYAKVNPSVTRDDGYWGMLLSMFFNAHRGENESTLSPADFMPYYDKFEEELPLEQLLENLGLSHLNTGI